MPDTTTTGTITLSQPHALEAGGFEVDRESGVVRGVSVISEGEALGHGFKIDGTMLSQVEYGIKRTGAVGVKSRLTHPSQGVFGGGRDPIETMLGRIKNPRVEGGKVRADLHVGKFAEHSPSGNLREFVLGVAEEDPSLIGLSISFDPDQFEELDDGTTAGRVGELLAVDVVGDPAANPAGMLSAERKRIHQEVNLMNEKQKDFLRGIGLPFDATDEQTAEFIEAMSEEQKAQFNALKDSEEVEEAADAAEQQGESSSNGGGGGNGNGSGGGSSNNNGDMGSNRKETTMSTSGNGGQQGGETALAETATQNKASEIKALAELSGLGSDWALEQITAGVSVEDAKKAALKKKREESEPVKGLHITGGEDRNLSTLKPAISDAIMLRADAVKIDKPHERANEFRGLSVLDMYRQYLAALGVRDAWTLSRTRLVHLLGPREFRQTYPRAFELAQSTSDFDSILADVQNKTLRQAYLDAPVTWNIWARRTTAPDFKDINRTALSESPDLVARNEGGEIVYVTLGETNESYALVEYVNGIKITRKAMINDDLEAFGRAPMLQGQASRRKEEDVAYAILTDNAALDTDSTALFHADHSNLASSTPDAGAPSVSTLAATEALIMLQKGPKSAAQLNLQAQYLIVPVALKATTQQLINSTVDPSKSNSATNPYANMFTVVPNARLDADSSTAWYLAADPSEIDTVEVAFLADEPEPVLKQEQDFDTDDMKFGVRHTVAAKAIDFRGLAKNNGA